MARTVEHWYRRKYLLPETDPRFLEATQEQMLTDYWAWHYFSNHGEEEIVDDDFNLEEELRKNAEEAEAELADVEDWEDVP